MRSRAILVGLIALITILACSRGEKIDKNDAVNAAVIAAENWLEQVDGRNITGSWEATAEIFKKGGDLAKWQSALEEASKVYGKLVSRLLREALYKSKLPGGGRGHFVVIQYDSVYENREKVLETITPMLEKDGHWRVAGYIVK